MNTISYVDAYNLIIWIKNAHFPKNDLVYLSA